MTAGEECQLPMCSVRGKVALLRHKREGCGFASGEGSLQFCVMKEGLLHEAWGRRVLQFSVMRFLSVVKHMTQTDFLLI